MPTLYEIDQEYQQIAAWLEEREGDISGVEADLDAWLEGLGEARDQKIDGYCALIREYLGKAEVRAGEAERLRDLAEQDRSNADRLKRRLHEFLQRQGLKKLETERFKLTVAKNGGADPVRIQPGTNPADVEPAYQRVRPPEIDTEAVRAALKAGKAIKFAELGERGTHLRIR